MLEKIKSIIEIIAFFAAGSYFIYKLIDGWGLLNLSMELEAERQKGEETDLILIVLKLNKGDRGSLELQTVELKCEVENREPNIVRIPLIYPLKQKSDVELQDKDMETRIKWDKIDTDRPRLHLTPGESAQYSHVFQVPCRETCKVEAIVVGKRPVSIRFGQWRSSISVL